MLDKKLAYFVVTRINYVLFFVRLLCNHKQDLLEAQTCVSRTPASNFDVNHIDHIASCGVLGKYMKARQYKKVD